MGVASWGDIIKFSLVRSTRGLGYGLIGSLLPLYFSNRYGVGSARASQRLFYRIY